MMRDARALYWHLTAHTAHSLVGFTSSDGAAAETKASLDSAICTMAEVGLQNGDLLLFKYWITGTVWSSKQNAAQSETHCVGIRTLMYCNILWALKLSFQYGHLNRLVFHEHHLWRQHHAWYQAQLTYFFTQWNVCHMRTIQQFQWRGANTWANCKCIQSYTETSCCSHISHNHTA